MKGEDKDFIQKHILLRDFERQNLADSKTLISLGRYLEEKKLCGRVPVQSFIDAPEKEVKDICSKEGLHVSGNLCLSKSSMIVYDVESTFKMKGCEVLNVSKQQDHKVVVACDKVGNKCIPVHYQAKINVIPKGGPCTK
uniref:Ribonuclease A-domain domain-containing protein n=1 Tax=Sparus aurata TaxID=8175 RepID=A0A671WGJ4_SPAAU